MPLNSQFFFKSQPSKAKNQKLISYFLINMQEVISSIVNSDNPDSSLESLIISDLKTHSKYDPFDSQHEVKILISYYKDVLNFGKSILMLTPSKQQILLSISNTLICAGTISKPRKPISDLKAILNESKSSFNPADLNAIFEYFSSNYFQHLRLYNYIFSSRENTETTHIQALIDEPLCTMPLIKAVQRVKNRLPIEDNVDLKAMQRSRSKIGTSRRGADSKEPPADMVLDSQASEDVPIDPVEEKMQKLHGDIESELHKHESAIEQEIEELRKRYK